MCKSISANKGVIAITGKGGAGKTTFTAMMTKILMETSSDLKILLIDGDPAMGLSSALGVEVRRTVGEVREAIIGAARTSKKQGKAQITGMLDWMVLDALVELEGFSLLVMGRTETLGCFCPVNDLLRGAIESLSKSFDIVLIDCEAGLEQINRKVVQSVNELIIITDATLRGVQTAALINKIIHTHNILPCGEVGLVLNKVRGEAAPIIQTVEKMGLKILGSIPDDENITKYDLVGRPIIDLPTSSPSLIAAKKILEAVLSD